MGVVTKSSVLRETRALSQRDGQDSDAEVLAHYGQTGQCYYYYTNQKNPEKAVAPCKVWCEKNGDASSYACDASEWANTGLEHGGIIFRDDDGYPVLPAKCGCNYQIIEDALNLVLEGLSKLDEFLCIVMLETFRTVLDITVNFIPGGPGARAAVQGAKTFAENGLEASSFFGDWVGPACGVPDWNFDLFTALLNQPDSVGVSTGCHRKNKADCRKLDPKPDPPNKPIKPIDGPTTRADNKPTTKSTVDKPTSKAVDKSTTKTDKTTSRTTNKATETTSVTSKSTSTSQGSTTSTDTPGACQLAKRAPPPEIREGRFGEDERSEECNNNVKTVHITKTDMNNVGFYEELIEQKCGREFSQACYHYSSVMDVHRATRDMTQWTCLATPDTSRSGSATRDWGRTAIVKKIGADEQHWWPWANGFVFTTIAKDAKGKNVAKHCEKDEWPPRYFWPGDNNAPAHMVQRIRLVPSDENQGGGRIWKGFCNDNNAISTTKKPRQKKQSYIQSKLIRTQPSPKVDQAKQGIDKIDTIISTVTVSTLRAIFKITDWDNLPKDDKWYGLKDNKCWPKALAPDDPGWVLLTNDEFYQQGQHPDLQVHTQSYRKLPDLARVQQALAANNGQPPYAFKDVKKNYILGNAEGEVQAPYRGVLPGVVKRNETISAQDLHDGSEPDEELVDTGEYSDEEFEQWMEGYLELMNEIHPEEVSNTVPPTTDARPTPRGQGDATPTPATEGLRKQTS